MCETFKPSIGHWSWQNDQCGHEPLSQDNSSMHPEIWLKNCTMQVGSHILTMQKIHSVLLTQVHLRRTESGHMFCGHIIPRFVSFWINNNVQKMKKTVQVVISKRCKMFIMLWGSRDDLQMSEGTLNEETYVAVKVIIFLLLQLDKAKTSWRGESKTTTDCWLAKILHSPRMNTDSAEMLQKWLSSVSKW